MRRPAEPKTSPTKRIFTSSVLQRVGESASQHRSWRMICRCAVANTVRRCRSSYRAITRCSHSWMRMGAADARCGRAISAESLRQPSFGGSAGNRRKAAAWLRLPAEHVVVCEPGHQALAILMGGGLARKTAAVVALTYPQLLSLCYGMTCRSWNFMPTGQCPKHGGGPESPVRTKIQMAIQDAEAG